MTTVQVLPSDWTDVPSCPSMSLLPHVVSVRMYDADDHQVVS